MLVFVVVGKMCLHNFLGEDVIKFGRKTLQKLYLSAFICSVSLLKRSTNLSFGVWYMYLLHLAFNRRNWRFNWMNPRDIHGLFRLRFAVWTGTYFSMKWLTMFLNLSHSLIISGINSGARKINSSSLNQACLKLKCHQHEQNLVHWWP